MIQEKNIPPTSVGLHQLSIHDFAPFVQGDFTILFPAGEKEPATLAAVLALTGHSDLERKPFSIVLQTSQTRFYYPQAIYSVVHPQLGVLQIFLVPLGVKNGGVQYEAVFS